MDNTPFPDQVLDSGSGDLIRAASGSGGLEYGLE
jgi:hypothetical protein